MSTGSWSGYWLQRDGQEHRQSTEDVAVAHELRDELRQEMKELHLQVAGLTPTIDRLLQMVDSLRHDLGMGPMPAAERAECEAE